jgi:hypothetical protein
MFGAGIDAAALDADATDGSSLLTVNLPYLPFGFRDDIDGEDDATLVADAEATDGSSLLTVNLP